MIRIKDLGAGVDPAAVVKPISAGSDDRASITITDYVKALDAHKDVPSGVAVLTPGLFASVTAEKIGQHAAEHRKIYLTDLEPDTTVDEATAVGDQLMGKPNSHVVGLVYPAIRIPDLNQRTRTVGGAAYAAAALSLIHI